MPVKKVSKKTVAPKRPKGHSYGWSPDLPDHRDLRYGAVYKIPAVLPPSADLRPLCPPVEDQGQLGSCTAHALTGALEVLEKKDNLTVAQMSRLFVYYNERLVEHTVMQDSGAMLRDGIKTLAAYGCCGENRWPYIIGKFAQKPTPACYKDGAAHQITSYQRLDTLDQMRACLAEGFPFVFGFTVYESFESQATAKSGIVNMPGASERTLGGHAVLAVGYNDGQKRITVRNSWGADWGMQGYFSMPYDYVASRDLSDDFWTIRRGEEM
ncbi:MAG: C1 family peptidase [Chitinivibrionales bacterium]|nr:C1 family peptidase [Chitinivibrionales bacterium]